MDNLKIGKAVVAFILLVLTTPAFSKNGTNRTNLPRSYLSEISVSEAFLLSTQNKAIIIDVRTLEEHAVAHPAGSYNIPYPNITCLDRAPQSAQCPCGEYEIQTDQDFIDAVETKFPDKNTPLLTLCRSGVRSVYAANILANAGYSNVRNIWEGFEGVPRKTIIKGKEVTHDLNNNGKIDEGDNEGWKNFAKLPYETVLAKDPYLFEPKLREYKTIYNDLLN